MKPLVVYEHIRRFMPGAKYFELFARGGQCIQEGFTALGNQVPESYVKELPVMDPNFLDRLE